MTTLAQIIQYLPVLYSAFMGVMGALATTLGVVDVVISMTDRMFERKRRQRKI